MPDTVDYWDYLHIIEVGSPPKLSVSASDRGCGCCADSRTVTDMGEAIALVETYLDQKRGEIKLWERWLAKMATSKELINHGTE